MVMLLLMLMSQPALSLNGEPLTALRCDGGIVCSRRGSVATLIGTPSAGSGSGAPVDGGYVVWSAAASSGSTNERVLTAGTNVTLSTATPGQLIVNASGGSSSDFDGGYNVMQDEGVDLTKRTTIDFTGAGVSCVDTGSKTQCTIAGGGGASQSPLSITLRTP